MSTAILIGREARRLVRHPVLWLVPVIVAVTSAADSASNGRNADYWYATIFTAVTFFAPIIVLFTANLVASGARRSRAEEILSATPTSDTRRTWAMSLGIALPLAAVGAIAAAAMAVISSLDTIPAKDLMNASELAQLPLVITGAGLLGVLAARWLPFPGGILITFILATIGGLVAFRHLAGGTWWMWWTTGMTFEGWTPPPGRPWIHVAYLTGLCACAAIAAVYRSQGRRLLLIGGPILAATLVLGSLQLP